MFFDFIANGFQQALMGSRRDHAVIEYANRFVLTFWRPAPWRSGRRRDRFDGFCALHRQWRQDGL